jgi:hypothetical protein
MTVYVPGVLVAGVIEPLTGLMVSPVAGSAEKVPPLVPIIVTV